MLVSHQTSLVPSSLLLRSMPPSLHPRIAGTAKFLDPKKTPGRFVKLVDPETGKRKLSDHDEFLSNLANYHGYDLKWMVKNVSGGRVGRGIDWSLLDL